MGKALTLSLIIHVVLVSAMIWSTNISIAIFRAQKLHLETAGVIQVDMTYKASDTAFRKGDEKKDLPPPIIKTEKKEEVVTKAPSKKPTKKEDPKKKFDLKSLMAKMRQEAGREQKKPPKDDNFPMKKDGEENSRGTGGRATRQATPGELALQSAMRRYFEFPQATEFRKENPNALGFFVLKLVGSGSRFELASIRNALTTGFDFLDDACEAAIRKALQNENFGDDVIQELSGKEATITCKP